MIGGQIPIIVIIRIILGQQFGYLLTENAVKFRSADIFIASHTLLDALNNLQCGIYTHIAGDEYLFKIIQYIIINLRLTGYGTSQFIEHTRFGFLQTLIERLLFILTKKSK